MLSSPLVTQEDTKWHGLRINIFKQRVQINLLPRAPWKQNEERYGLLLILSKKSWDFSQIPEEWKDDNHGAIFKKNKNEKRDGERRVGMMQLRRVERDAG